MIIRAYRTSAFQNISEYETDEINVVGENLSEEEKDFLRNDQSIPMLCFAPKNDEVAVQFVPIQFVISIRDN